jgi:hypothetical protein
MTDTPVTPQLVKRPNRWCAVSRQSDKRVFHVVSGSQALEKNCRQSLFVDHQLNAKGTAIA